MTLERDLSLSPFINIRYCEYLIHLFITLRFINLLRTTHLQITYNFVFGLQKESPFRQKEVYSSIVPFFYCCLNCMLHFGFKRNTDKGRQWIWLPFFVGSIAGPKLLAWSLKYAVNHRIWKQRLIWKQRYENSYRSQKGAFPLPNRTTKALFTYFPRENHGVSSCTND